ncbi:MAG: hypothetical protein J6866_06660 [Victivallales bacterium]|nr:hypothetical protein [Victivallales bacterium]
MANNTLGWPHLESADEFASSFVCFFIFWKLQDCLRVDGLFIIIRKSGKTSNTSDNENNELAIKEACHNAQVVNLEDGNHAERFASVLPSACCVAEIGRFLV